MRLPALLAALCCSLPLLLAADLEPIGWGVVSAPSTPAYDKTGKRLGELKGGRFFTVCRQVTIGEAPAFYVELDDKRATKCIVAASAAKAFLEMPNPDNPAEVEGVRKLQELFKDYYGTLAGREQLVERARERHRAGSPAAKAAKAKAELAAIPAKEREYEAAQQKAASNAERLRCQDLRKELRYRATGLQAEIKRIEAEAAAWDAAHPFDERAARRSAACKRMTQRLRELEPALRLYGVQPAAD